MDKRLHFFENRVYKKVKRKTNVVLPYVPKSIRFFLATLFEADKTFDSVFWEDLNLSSLEVSR